MEIIAVYNIKGGVGKSTTAVNLAYRSAADGWPTLLWDLDPQGAATYIMRRDAFVEGGSKGIVSGDAELSDLIASTDYPHLDSTWPNTQEVIRESLKGLPADDITKITWENAARLFRHPVPEAVQRDPNAY